MKHTITILLSMFVIGCSTVTQYTDPDGRTVFTATNVLDESDRQIAANVAAGGTAEMTFPAALFGPQGELLGVGAGSMALAGPGTLTYVEGGDRTGVAREGVRAWGMVQSLKTWVRGDVAKATESEKTAREGLRQTGETRRTGIGAVQSLGNNPEANSDAIREAARAVR